MQQRNNATTQQRNNATTQHRHVMRYARHHYGMRVVVVAVILVRYGQRQEDHTCTRLRAIIIDVYTQSCTCARQVIIMSSGKLSLPELIRRQHLQDRAIDVASASFVHRHRSFINRDASRRRQVRSPASYHYRRPASFIHHRCSGVKRHRCSGVTRHHRCSGVTRLHRCSGVTRHHRCSGVTRHHRCSGVIRLHRRCD